MLKEWKMDVSILRSANNYKKMVPLSQINNDKALKNKWTSIYQMKSIIIHVLQEDLCHQTHTVKMIKIIKENKIELLNLLQNHKFFLHKKLKIILTRIILVNSNLKLYNEI